MKSSFAKTDNSKQKKQIHHIKNVYFDGFVVIVFAYIRFKLAFH